MYRTADNVGNFCENYCCFGKTRRHLRKFPRGSSRANCSFRALQSKALRPFITHWQHVPLKLRCGSLFSRCTYQVCVHPFWWAHKQMVVEVEHPSVIVTDTFFGWSRGFCLPSRRVFRQHCVHFGWQQLNCWRLMLRHNQLLLNPMRVFWTFR